MNRRKFLEILGIGAAVAAVAPAVVADEPTESGLEVTRFNGLMSFHVSDGFSGEHGLLNGIEQPVMGDVVVHAGHGGANVYSADMSILRGNIYYTGSGKDVFIPYKPKK